MRENVTISYRGASYEIGRGNHFYGIWAAGAPGSPLLEWWPETVEGWAAAWSRFTGIEAPGSIVPAAIPPARPAAGPEATPAPARGTRATIIAAALLFLGVACGLAGLFPVYLGGQSLAGQADELVPHLIYLAAWTASAVLILRGGSRLQAGALVGAGVSVVTLGMFLADLGQVISGTQQPGGPALSGAGLWLGLIGWLACAAGAGYALWISRTVSLARPQVRELGPIVLVLLAGIGAAIAFAPSWDSYVLHFASGATESVTAGYAFANPGAVIAGNVVTMVAVVAVAAAAALWRHARHGALLLVGAIIPLAAQAISALVQQFGQSADPELFGVSPAQATQVGLTISSGVTAAFWVYCVFVVALAASCAWMLLTPDSSVLGLPHLRQAQPPGFWGPVMAGAPGGVAGPGMWPAPGAPATQSAPVMPATQSVPVMPATQSAPAMPATPAPEGAPAGEGAAQAEEPAPPHDAGSAPPHHGESAPPDDVGSVPVQDGGSVPPQD